MNLRWFELASEKPLNDDEVAILGHFRQLYQQLRQSIRDDQPLKWDYAEHPDYMAFKELALIVGTAKGPELSSNTLVKITSNKWERN